MNWQEVAFRESPRSVLEAAEMEEEQGEEEAEGDNLQRRLEDGSDLMSESESLVGNSRRGEQEEQDELEEVDEGGGRFYAVDKFLAVRKIPGPSPDTEVQRFPASLKPPVHPRGPNHNTSNT